MIERLRLPGSALCPSDVIWTRMAKRPTRSFTNALGGLSVAGADHPARDQLGIGTRIAWRQCMPFVVKATIRDVNICWLAPSKAWGARTLGPRERAEVFQTQREAHAAIAAMLRVRDRADANFSIESAD
jgi:hypothetical protein